jgi:hypothetical protein
MTAASINTRINLLLTSATGESSPELGEALKREAERIQTQLPPHLTAGAGIGLNSADVARVIESLQGGGRSDFGSEGFQGLLWVVGPGGTIDELTQAVDGVAARLADFIDPALSAAVAGTEEIFLPGDGPKAGMYAVRRLPTDTHEHFHDFWRLEHTKLSMYIPGFKYRQLHAAVYASKRAADVAGLGISDIDGIIEYYFESIQFQLDMLKLENFSEIYEDEKNFIDHSRSTFSYVEFL